MPTQLHVIKAYREGREGPVTSYNAHGACVGVFAYGSNRLASYEFDHVLVQFGWASGSRNRNLFCKKLAECKLIQALTPGVEYRENPDNGGGYVDFYFPNVADRPSDMVATSMRIIKSWTAGYYDDFLQLIADNELSFDEFVPIITFCANQSPFSDSYPGLHRLSKDGCIPFEEETGYLRVGNCLRSGKRAVAGMLLPLIRGEVNQGWMPPFKQGYIKSGGVVSAIIGDDDWNICDVPEIRDMADDTLITVNNPCIILNAETRVGPEIQDLMNQNNPRIQEIIDWVQERINS